MSEETENSNSSENGEKETSEEKAKKGSSKLLIFIIIGLVILGAAGAGAWFFLFKKPPEKEEHKAEVKEHIEFEFLTLPEILVNLRTNKSRGNILKAVFILELSTAPDKEKIEKFKPLIVDQFQTFLRDLEFEDLQGGIGIERIRQELFKRINAIVTPVAIRRVLVKDFLIQ